MGAALNHREGEVAILISEGKQNKDIAFALGITVATVKVYVSSIYRKIGLQQHPGNSRTTLTRLILGQGTDIISASKSGGFLSQGWPGR